MQSTAAWIHDRIARLPDTSPDPNHHHHRGSNSVPLSAAAQKSRRAASLSPRAAVGGAAHHDDEATQDLVYQAVRSAALIYARASMHRRPLRDPVVCSSEDVMAVWTTVWRVPLRVWKGLLGIFVWVVLSILPAASLLARQGDLAIVTAHARFIKSLMAASLVQISLEDWVVAEAAMKGAVALVGWLGGGQDNIDGTLEDQTGVDVVDPALQMSP